MKPLKLFIPLTKVDAKQRLVYGVATAETPDRSGEIFDYATSVPYYKSWSENFEKVTDGKSLGNVRAMHGNVAAGKLTQINYNDEQRQIEVCAKIVDDVEWKKVEEGVYTGFSQGGEYIKKWKDGALTRYTASPAEVSLVDLPCVPEATFEYIKADGAKELRKFVKADGAEAEDEEDEDKREEEGEEDDEKAKGEAEEDKKDKEGTSPKDTAEKAGVPSNKSTPDVEQVWKARDGSTFATKAEAVKHNQELLAKAEADKLAAPVENAMAALNKALDTAGAPAEEAPAAPDAGKQAPDKVELTPVQKMVRLYKGLWNVGRLACLIEELDWLMQDTAWEATYEGDGSPIPAELKDSIVKLSAVLRGMVAEETSELVGEDDAPALEAEAATLEAAAEVAAAEADMALSVKIGALTKALPADKHVKALAFIKGRLEKRGAPPPAKEEEPNEELSKVVAQRSALEKVLTNLAPQIETLAKRVAKLEARPAPAKGVVKAVNKGEDGAGAEGVHTGNASEQAESYLASLTSDQRAQFLMKVSLRNPVRVIER